LDSSSRVTERGIGTKQARLAARSRNMRSRKSASVRRFAFEPLSNGRFGALSDLGG